MKNEQTTRTFQGVFLNLTSQNLKVKQGHYYGKDHSILNLNLDNFFEKLRSIFWTVQVKIETVQDGDWKKSGELVGQYMMITSTK